MNLSKTQWIIVSVIAAVAIYLFFIRKNKMSVESSYQQVGPARPPKPKTPVCVYPNGEKCKCGTPYCYKIGEI